MTTLFKLSQETVSMRRSSLLSALALGAVFASSVLQAQTAGATDPRFQPWLGCWRSAMPVTPEQGTVPTRACVLPSLSVPGSVDITLYATDSLLSRIAIPRPGTTRERTLDECRGSETSEWIAKESQLMMRAILTCARGTPRTETALMTITPAGEWMQFQHMDAGTNSAISVARFRFDAEGTDRDARMLGDIVSTPTLRLAAGGRVSPEQVLDVAKHVPVGLAEAWLTELHQPFALDGKQLVQLADAGMPERVLDMMVALSNPRAFAVGGRSASGEFVSAQDRAEYTPQSVASQMRMAGQSTRGSSACRFADDFCYGALGYGAWGMGWAYGRGIDPWGFPYPRYGYGFGNMYGYGYGAYGYPYYGNYYGNNPVIIVTNPGGGGGSGGNGSNTGTTRGRAVNGQGYTRANSAPSDTRSSGQFWGGSGSSTSTPASAPASSGGSSGGGEARTAKPRGGG